MLARMSYPTDPRDHRSVVDDLSTLVRAVIGFGTTVGTSIGQLDAHRDDLARVHSLLDRLAAEKERENDLKEREEKRLARAGGQNHELRMRLLTGAGGLLTGSIVPALLYYFLGYEPKPPVCPPPSITVPAMHDEVKHAPLP